MNYLDVVALASIEVVDMGSIDLGFDDRGRPCGLCIAPIVPQNDVVALNLTILTIRR